MRGRRRLRARCPVRSSIALHHIDCPWRPADIEQREGRIVRQGNQNDEVRIIRYATEGSFDVYMWQTVERKGTFISQLVRGDNVGRDIDDVGDAVLSFAEVKALASGNPLVIEQAGVQADLAKLERLEHAHREEQRQLKERARRSRQHAGRARGRADELRAAIKHRVDTTGDRFAMEIGGQRHTKRPDAAKHFMAELQAAFQDLSGGDTWRSHAKIEPRRAGVLAGFDVTIEGYRLNDNVEVVLKTHLSEHQHRTLNVRQEDLKSDKFNVIARLENPIRHLDETLASTEQEIADLEDQAASLEARLGQPFPRQDQLAKLRARHQEILDQLNTEAETTAAAEEASRQPPTPPNPTTRLNDLKEPPATEPPPLGEPGL